MTKIGLATPKAAFVNTSALKQKFRAEYESRKAAIEGQGLEGAALAKALAAFEGGGGRRREPAPPGIPPVRPDAGAGGRQGHRLPAIVRPSFTMGGLGGGIAYTMEDLNDIVLFGVEASPTNEVLVEESVLGWKEYEMEVVRDRDDNCIIVCSIENNRSDGRPHRRFDHGRAGADADGTRNTRSCATPLARCCARSASRPAAPTFSSR